MRCINWIPCASSPSNTLMSICEKCSRWEGQVLTDRIALLKCCFDFCCMSKIYIGWWKKLEHHYFSFLLPGFKDRGCCSKLWFVILGHIHKFELDSTSLSLSIPDDEVPPLGNRLVVECVVNQFRHYLLKREKVEWESSIYIITKTISLILYSIISCYSCAAVTVPDNAVLKLYMFYI